MTPNGVKIAKSKIIAVTKFYSSGKVLAMEIPSDIPAAPLCIAIATANKKTSAGFYEIPSASPSKTECVPKPINKINGVIFSRHDGFLSLTISAFTG